MAACFVRTSLACRSHRLDQKPMLTSAEFKHNRRWRAIYRDLFRNYSRARCALKTTSDFSNNQAQCAEAVRLFSSISALLVADMVMIPSASKRFLSVITHTEDQVDAARGFSRVVGDTAAGNDGIRDDDGPISLTGIRP